MGSQLCSSKSPNIAHMYCPTDSTSGIMFVSDDDSFRFMLSWNYVCLNCKAVVRGGVTGVNKPHLTFSEEKSVLYHYKIMEETKTTLLIIKFNVNRLAQQHTFC